MKRISFLLISLIVLAGMCGNYAGKKRAEWHYNASAKAQAKEEQAFKAGWVKGTQIPDNADATMQELYQADSLAYFSGN